VCDVCECTHGACSPSVCPYVHATTAVLLPLIKLRLVTSISMSATTILADPSNEEYLLVHARPAMTLLQELADADTHAFMATLLEAAAL
jgi:hypothetical protein